MELVTKQELMEALDKDKTVITDELVNSINMIILDEPEVGSLIKEKFMNYSHILQQGKYSMEAYLNAVTFVSYKLMNMTNIDAYRNTFPGRYDKLKVRYVDVEGLSEEDFEQKVSSYVYAVAKSKMVTTMLSQVQIPTKLLNMGLLQEAINVEAVLMRSAKSEIVREKAANTLIQYLGDEEEHKIQVDMGFRKDEVIDQYELAMKKMVEEQLDLIGKGADVKAIANAKIIEVEVLEEA